MTRVITYGTYDLLHYGHIRLLERAKALGDYLIVGVTSDDYDRTRGKINNQQSLMERVAAVKATGLADEIVVEEYEGQKIDDIRRLHVDIFTVGSDWVGKFDYLNEYCKVVYLDRTQGVSSSELRAEKRKIKIGIIGNLAIASKFREECQYVNGVEVIDNAEEAEAVYIVSLPSEHYGHIKKALEKKQHVLCEAPIATLESDCKELITLAHRNNLILFDGIKTAYSTAYSRLLLIAKSGRIGSLISVDVTCTSLKDGMAEKTVVLHNKQNSICAWGPTALLPVFQLLGVNYARKQIVSHFLDNEKKYDGFTKIDFVYKEAVASVKVAKAAKSEGELVVTGTKGYIYVPAPWWKTDYFEVRYENPENNRRYFYELEGNGIRYEIASFAKAIASRIHINSIDSEISNAIAKIVEDCQNHHSGVIEI